MNILDGGDLMPKKKIILVSATVVLSGIIVFSIFTYIYDNYYKIDTSPFSYSFLARYGESPNGEYSASIKIYRTVKDSDISYIMGNVSRLDSHRNVIDTKTIFWQKVESASVNNKKVNGMVLDDWVDFNWVDSQTVFINGITLNIKNKYDYRRK